jgi:hypothetical protein
MTAKSNLPLRPMLFILCYLLALPVALIPSFFWVPLVEYWGELAVGLMLALQLLWACQMLSFLSTIASKDEAGTIAKSKSRLTILFVMLGACLIYTTVYNAVVDSHSSGAVAGTMLDPRSLFFGFIFTVLILLVFWTVARTLYEVEEGQRPPAYAVIGTFLGLIYLIVGVTFIYRRLKVLERRGAA